MPAACSHLRARMVSMDLFQALLQQCRWKCSVYLLVSLVQAMAPLLPYKMHVILRYNFMDFGDPLKLTHVTPKFQTVTVNHYTIIKAVHSQKCSFSVRLPETSSVRRYTTLICVMKVNGKPLTHSPETLHGKPF